MHFCLVSLLLVSAASYSASPGRRVELHIHLDGSISVQTLFQACLARNISLPLGIGRPRSIDDVQRYLDSATIAWHKFDIVNDIIGGDPISIRQVAREFGLSQADAGAIYTEVRYDPDRMARSGLLNVTISMEEAVKAVENGLMDAAKERNVYLYQLLSAMRGQDAEHCRRTVELASRMSSRRMGGVVGVDLAGSETEYPNPPYIDCLRYAKRDLGLNVTVHSGEFTPAEADDVRSAIEDVKADRVGHGYAAATHPELLARLREGGIHVETCPQKGEWAWQAIKVFKSHDISFGINTDDPTTYFRNTSLAKVEGLLKDNLKFDEGDIHQAYESALSAAFGDHPGAAVLLS